MSSFNWEGFLRQWSQELLNSKRNDQEKLPLEVIESGWLGYPGATEEQITYAETRLGTILLPSYREFLKVSNGWRQTTPFIDKLWSTEDIEWFAVRHQAWINAFIERYRDNRVNGRDASLQNPLISNAEYFVYGEAQDCSKLRLEYVQTALEITDKGDSVIYLLNPQVITEDGEWEAWFFGDWLPGADRYKSFQQMMQAEYQNFLELKET
ncbi:MAG: SMI1/KNR4 family protein [Symploca sp. SIO2C1]|nr:SMI1/KNR4 family protein [Symploca sp. SIO2C1]